MAQHPSSTSIMTNFHSPRCRVWHFWVLAPLLLWVQLSGFIHFHKHLQSEPNPSSYVRHLLESSSSTTSSASSSSSTLTQKLIKKAIRAGAAVADGSTSKAKDDLHQERDQGAEEDHGQSIGLEKKSIRSEQWVKDESVKANADERVDQGGAEEDASSVSEDDEQLPSNLGRNDKDKNIEVANEENALVADKGRRSSKEQPNDSGENNSDSTKEGSDIAEGLKQYEILNSNRKPTKREANDIVETLRQYQVMNSNLKVRHQQLLPSVAVPLNITLGVVANEFFDPKLGRTGGFGMATNMLGKFFNEHPELGVKIVYIFSKPTHGNNASHLETQVYHELLGWPLISHNNHSSSEAIHKANIDVLLLIDYRDDYRIVIKEVPDAPIILWARDPRTRQQIRNLEGTRLPKSMNYTEQPEGVTAPKAVRAVKLFEQVEKKCQHGRRMVLGLPWTVALRDRIYEAYNISHGKNAYELNNIVEGTCGKNGQPIVKSETPAVIFMGRLDAYKRPWLLVDLARKFPHVQFWVFGRRHMYDPESSYDIHKDSGPLPSNIELFGQLTGDEKWEKFAKAWFVVSLSAHEGLAINYLEALQCKTPILSTVNPGGIVSSYGIFAGEFSGSGEQGLPALQSGFQKLLDDASLREKLGKAGRMHVLETHSAERFSEGFQRIVNMLDLPKLNSTMAMENTKVDPVSIVIPSYQRLDTLPTILAHLLTRESMAHMDSEVVLAHVSQESWDQRAAIHTDTNRLIVSQYGGSSYLVTKINHVNYVEKNSRWGCASRYFAAKEAHNDILIHLDDDLLPEDEALFKMIDYVRNEPGFPFYNGTYNLPQFYGKTKRFCGKEGYHSKMERVLDVYEDKRDAHIYILTNFAAMSYHLNREFVQEFKKNTFYKAAMTRFKGNGCDLIFAHHFDGKGIYDKELKYTMHHKYKEEALDGKFYGGDNHRDIRVSTCKCLYSNFTADCLMKIPR